MSAPKGDRVVLLLTFLLTVFVDLTVAIEVGIVVAALVFMFRMSEAMEVSAGVRTTDDDLRSDTSGDDAIDQRARLPKDVEAYQISGPLFFGTANRLDNLLDQFPKPPRAFILRMRLVPVIDASGVHALQKLADRCHRKGIALIVSGLQEQPNRVLARMETREHPGELHLAPDFEYALRLAERLALQESPAPAQ
jgi:SulP family sulfate permease